ncbi:hypothetical protein ACXYUI_28830, partial [Klebsiella pneumoniae]
HRRILPSSRFIHNAHCCAGALLAANGSVWAAPRDERSPSWSTKAASIFFTLDEARFPDTAFTD